MKIELKPAAWVDGAALRWLADPARSSDAYIETTLNTGDPAGVRTALYTAEQMDSLTALVREECAKLCDAVGNRPYTGPAYNDASPRTGAWDCAAAIREQK